MSGVTSPARRWFRLTTPDAGLAELGPVKKWLADTETILNNTFLKSNLYNVLPTLYGDMGDFGTGCMFAEEDHDDVIRFHVFPIGSYMLAKDHKGRVNTFFREFRMTVAQLVEKFAVRKGKDIVWDNISNHVRTAYDRGETEMWVDVCHCIKPSDDFIPGVVLNSKNKRFESCYYEKGLGAQGNTYLTADDDNRYLREEGYDLFPVLAPRWETTGEDVYGTACPGMRALGDIRALQLMEKRKAQAIEKMVNPPMVYPVSMKTQKASILPGDATYVDSQAGNNIVRPAHEVRINIGELLQDISNHEMRINKAYFADLFLMLANSDRRDFTAREIDERHEEKLLALGPVLESLNQDCLDPLIDLAFEFHKIQGRLPEPPEEIQGMNLKVEYTSVMAEAQKLAGVAKFERFLGFVGQAAQIDPRATRKVNVLEGIDLYGDILSVPPGLVRTDEEVAEMDAAEAQAVQAQNKMQMLRDVTASAKDLSQADLGSDNALSRIVQARNEGA